MITQAATHGPAITSAHAIYCKFLVDRKSYIPCHISVPDTAQRLPAIALDGRFYSFFRVIQEPQKALAVATRLGKRDDEVAMTITKRGYILWVYEAQASYAPPASAPQHSLKPAFGPQACLMLGDSTSYVACPIKLLDGDSNIPGICYNGHYYSIFRKETDALKIISMVAKLSRKGDELLLALADSGYTLAVREPNAFLGS
ncbi:MAG TPA: hypothetical protein V6D07_13535 [Trichocoleus sp.]